MDDMKMLEQKAQQLSAEAERDKPKEKILFVRFVFSPFSFENLKREFYIDFNRCFKVSGSRKCYSLQLCRSDTSRSELAELSKQANPDEINIDDDEDEDDNQGPEGR